MEKHDLGRKVFFIYPHSVIQESLRMTLLANEYESYVLQEHAVIPKLLTEYPDAILFINIDKRLDENAWEHFIRNLVESGTYPEASVGILSYEDNKAIREKYLLDIGIQCGFVRLSLGEKESTQIILKTLEVNEAKGRRKYVRVKCGVESLTSFNAKIKGKIQRGVILDVSSVGMACRFKENVEAKKNTVLDDLQLNLKGTIIKVKGIVFGYHDGDPPTYVVLFDPGMESATRGRIRKFIFNTLDEEIESVVTELGRSTSP